MLRGNCGPLLRLSDVAAGLGIPESGRATGVHPIPLANIIGTVGRCCDFDRCFHPLKPNTRRHVAELQTTFARAQIPSIDVRRIDDAYFVLDGHHRVALARAIGMQAIDAEVTLLRHDHALNQHTAHRDLPVLAAAEEFARRTGLRAQMPHIRCAAVDGYAHLMEHVEAHAYRLSLRQSRVVEFAEAALDWYCATYRPTLDSPSARTSARLMRGLAPGDHFLALIAVREVTELECEAPYSSANVETPSS